LNCIDKNFTIVVKKADEKGSEKGVGEDSVEDANAKVTAH
jgi:hypothetical protein